MRNPQYVISGQLRRQEKKKLNELKRFVKMFWYYQDINRVYGAGLSDNDCNKLLNDTKEEIDLLEHQLSIKLEKNIYLD